MGILASWVVVSVLLLGSSTAFPLVSSCLGTAYFDPSRLSCVSCEDPLVPTPNGIGCQCAVGYLQSTTVSAGDASLECTRCPAGEMASKNASFCLPCRPLGNSSILPSYPASVYDAGNSVCACPAGSVLVERDAGNNVLPYFGCVACSHRSYVSDIFTCSPCPNPNMVRDEENVCQCMDGFTNDPVAVCLNSEDLDVVTRVYPISSAAVVKYNDITDSSGSGVTSEVDSAMFAARFPSAGTLCEVEEDIVACQALANLCVLQLYDPEADACVLFQSILDQRSGTVNGESDWKPGMPWLYYSNAQGVLRGLDLNTQFSFSLRDERAGFVHRMKYRMATYAVNGTFLGFHNLTNQLQFCSGSSFEEETYLYFGTNVKRECVINLNEFLYAPEPVFFDLYFEYEDDLFPVPVRVVNYRDSGRQVNINQKDQDLFDDILVRRFFLYDNMSGKRELNALPEVIRVAGTIILQVTLRQGETSVIYPPVLSIEYLERRLSDIEADADQLSSLTPTESLGSPKVSFSSEYTMVLERFWDTCLGFLITGVIVIAIMWMARLWAWMRRNQSGNIDTGFVTRAIVFLMSSGAIIFFLILYGISMYWFIFFKLQATVFCLLPGDGQYEAFYAIIAVAFVGQAIRVVDIVVRQCSVDIFFIDWEQSRGLLLPKTGEVHNAEPATISIWRSFFIANEWNELQAERRVNVTVTLVLLLFLLRGLGLEYLATPQPDFNDLTPGGTNLVLRFALTTSLWIILALLQVLLKFLIIHRFFGNPIVDFVDLLSLSNISCFILADGYSGFYIHGRSVHPYADVDMQELTTFLLNEEEGAAQPRGLEGSTQQSFEIFVDTGFRAAFDACYGSLLSPSAQAPTGNQRLASSVPASSNVSGPSLAILETHERMNRFLSSFINKTNPDHDYKNLDRKDYLNRLLNNPPDMHDKKSVFYNASENAFVDVLFYGSELDLLLFLILLYGFCDVMFSNTFASLIAVYVADRLLCAARLSMGEKNLARKSLVDDRFLI